MSLISDALKRQEQLRAVPGTGAAQREVAAVAPPEVAVAAPPEVAAAVPPEVAVAAPPEVAVAAPPETSPLQRPNFAASAAQPRAASPRPTSPQKGAQPRAASPRPTSSPQGTSPRRASGATSRGVAAQNPFLERERAAARRPNQSVLLMPILGLIMLLVLLFFRREFVPQESTETATSYSPRKVEEPAPVPIVLSRDDSSREEGTGNREEGTGKREQGTDEPSADGRDEARPSQTIDETVEVSDGAQLQNQREADEPSVLRQGESEGRGSREEGTGNGAQTAPTSPQLGGPTSRGDAAPNLAAPAAQPQPTTWPAFTLTGIAVGRERLAILNTGEMLLTGETAKCGVKVEKVNASTVVFTWGGETKTLRKGEHSDKPAD